MRMVLFSILGFNIYSHGVFFVLAMAISGWIYYRLANKQGLDTSKFLSNFIISIILAVIAARVSFYVLNINYYSSFYQLAEVWQGGLISFAGFIIGGLTFSILLKRQKANIPAWVDIAGIVFPLAIAIGRIGCVLNGEVGVRYFGLFSYYNHFPVTAFEIYLGLAIFTLNLYLYIYQRNRLIPFFQFYLFVALYSLVRVFIDSFRADQSIVTGINLSQLTSLIIFIASTIIFWLYYFNTKWRNNEN